VTIRLGIDIPIASILIIHVVGSFVFLQVQRLGTAEFPFNFGTKNGIHIVFVRQKYQSRAKTACTGH